MSLESHNDRKIFGFTLTFHRVFHNLITVYVLIVGSRGFHPQSQYLTCDVDRTPRYFSVRIAVRNLSFS